MLTPIGDNLAVATAAAVGLIDSQAVSIWNTTVQRDTALQNLALRTTERDLALTGLGEAQATIGQQASLITELQETVALRTTQRDIALSERDTALARTTELEAVITGIAELVEEVQA